jgi:ribosomal protein L40E
MGETKKEKKKKQVDTTRDELIVKRCPECFVSLPLDAKECFSCHSKVGQVDKHGKARKGVNWISYIICILSWTIFFVYIKWAFKL